MPTIYDRYYITDSKYLGRRPFEILKALIEHHDAHLPLIAKKLGISVTRIKQCRMSWLYAIYTTVEHRRVINGKVVGCVDDGEFINVD